MKQFEYYTDKILEEVWDLTGHYWTHQVSNTQILENLSHENDRVRTMRISHSMTFFSYGENYYMVFERLPDQMKRTKVTVSVELKFGYGAQWKQPSDLLIHWANLIGAQPIDFGRKPFIITWAVIGSIFICFILIGIVVPLIIAALA
ncbi:MAG: hypothetical protein ACFFDW_05650 [Candidatus Thorarchaeota archaeon]